MGGNGLLLTFRTAKKMFLTIDVQVLGYLMVDGNCIARHCITMCRCNCSDDQELINNL